MKARFLLTVPLCILLLGTPALAGSYGPYFCCDAWDTFGESFKMARDGQMLNPDAQSNLDPVEGLDGAAAQRVYNKYMESFTKQPGAGRGGAVGFVPLLSGPSEGR